MLLECVFLACILLYASYSWVFGFWDRRNVFNVKWDFNLGPVIDLLIKRKIVDDVFTDIYKNYKKEGIVGIYALFTPMVVITDPELAKTVLVKDFTKFGDTAMEIDERTDLLFSRHSFVTKGMEKWKELRGIQASIQTPAKFKEMLPIMYKVAETLVEHLKEKKMEPVKNNFLKYARGEQIFDVSPLTFVCHMLFPSISKLLRLRVLSHEAESFFLAFSKRAVDHRTESNTDRADIISYLIKANKKKSEENKPVYTDIDIAAQCLAFYADSTETSSNQLSFFLLDLANHPEVQERLRKEIFLVGKNAADLDLGKIQSINYLNMALNESIRIHSQVTSLGRTCTKDTVLRDVEIPTGIKVFIASGGFQKDPEYFPDPERYDPDRFSEENNDALVKFTYMPFGEGPRMCVGSKFALLQLKVAAIYILLNFTILPSNDNIKEEVGRGDTAILSPRENAMLRFVPLPKNN